MKTNKILSLAFLLFLQLMASAQSIILTLDSISSNTNCNDIWTEQNLDLSFVPGTTADCGPEACFFDVAPTYVWLWPSRLSVDLSSLQNIQKVEVDVVSYCSYFEPECTFAHLMDGTGIIINTVGNTINNPGNSFGGTLETLTINNPSEGFLSELAISSCEGNVHEIRIYQNILSTGNTWDCGPFGCYNPGTGAGEYTSIESCESICNPTSVICTSVSGEEITSVGFWENPNDPCDTGECTADGQFLEIVIDCEEEMGVPCNGEWVEVEGQCCSECVENVDLNEITNEEFRLIKMIDILGREKTEHEEGMILFYIYENGKVIKKIK